MGPRSRRRSGFTLIAKFFFFNVGLGDSIILQTESGLDLKFSIIDCSKSGGVVPVLDFLMANKIKTVCSLFITHYHSDHCSGLLELADFMLGSGSGSDQARIALIQDLNTSRT